MKKIAMIIVALLLYPFMLTGCSFGPKIVIGAKDFTEQDIVGNILRILVEKHTDLDVKYKNEMSSNILFAAIKSGNIDVYVDYTGTIYGNYLGHTEMKNSDEVYDICQSELSDKFDISLLGPIGFNNTYTLSVHEDIAREHNLKTFSDLAQVSSELTLGATFEILNRADGIPNLKVKYGMDFGKEIALDGTMRYTAIQNKSIDVTDAFSTDGLLLNYPIVTLEDDLNFFPPYHAVPIIRAQTLEKYPQLEPVLELLNSLIDDQTMRELNYKVDVQKHSAKKVATQFLEEKGLL